MPLRAWHEVVLSQHSIQVSLKGLSDAVGFHLKLKIGVLQASKLDEAKSGAAWILEWSKSEHGGKDA